MPGSDEPVRINRRLTARITVTRRYLVVAVLVGLLASVCIVAQAVLIATIVERALFHGARLGDVTTLLVGLGLAFGARAVCIWAGEVGAQRTSATVTSLLRRQLVRHALELGPAWLAGERSGELSLVAGRGIDALHAYFGRYLPQAVLAVVTPCLLLAWVGVADWPSLLILLGLSALVPVSMVLFGRESARRTGRQWRRLSSLASRYLELIQGLPTLRAFGRAEQGRREVAAANEGLRQTTMGTLRVAFLSALAMEMIAGLGVGLVAMLLGLRLLAGSLSLGTALAVLLVAPEVFLPMRRAGAEFHASAEGRAAADRILRVLDTPVPDQDHSPADGPPSGKPGSAARPTPAGPIRLPGPVRCHRVGVTYPDRAAPALADFDLLVEPGEHVSVVGPSGCGKSTLLAVLMRFVLPEQGRVTVGATALADLHPDEWRRQVAWVPQRPYLFRGTVADNLRMAKQEATGSELATAVEAAGLADFVAQLPRGVDTALGEGGLTLSAGERQRLAIARASLRDAPLVLLDEPVAHLDAHTEANLAESLGPWLSERTVIVAAHRAHVVARVDRVVTMVAPEAGGARPAAAGAPPHPPADAEPPLGARR